MDAIHIQDLRIAAFVGTLPREQRRRQPVLISLILECDLARAGRSDDLRDTVDYAALKRQVIALVASTRFQLVETLATRVAALCLQDRRLKAVTVRADKPTALTGARTVGVTIRRTRRTLARAPGQD